jgi:hypothetical protein
MVGKNMDDFEKAVENITFSEIKRASNLKDALDSINTMRFTAAGAITIH